MLHKSIPVHQAMNIPDASPAFDKEWDKVEKLPAWQGTNVKSKKEVIEKAQKKGRTVHVETMRDFCPPQELGVGTTVQKIQRSGGTSR